MILFLPLQTITRCRSAGIKSVFADVESVCTGSHSRKPEHVLRSECLKTCMTYRTGPAAVPQHSGKVLNASLQERFTTAERVKSGAVPFVLRTAEITQQRKQDMCISTVASLLLDWAL